MLEIVENIFKRTPDPEATILRSHLEVAGLTNGIDRQIDDYGKTIRVRTLVGNSLERSEVFRVSKDGKIESIFEGHFPVDYRDWGTVMLDNRPLISALALC